MPRISFQKEKDDDHDQDPLPKDLLRIRAWSSENPPLRRRNDQDSLKKRFATHMVMVL